jgi:preprotein translocase subunit SecD
MAFSVPSNVTLYWYRVNINYFDSTGALVTEERVTETGFSEPQDLQQEADRIAAEIHETGWFDLIGSNPAPQVSADRVYSVTAEVLSGNYDLNV